MSHPSHPQQPNRPPMHLPPHAVDREQPPARGPGMPRPSYGAAIRVAVAIAIVKWLLIVVEIVAVAVFGFMVFEAMNEGDSNWFPNALAALGCVVAIVLTWVLFGWFEQVLRMLTAIARNTQ